MTKHRKQGSKVKWEYVVGGVAVAALATSSIAGINTNVGKISLIRGGILPS